MEIRGFDFGPRQSGFVKVVIGLQVIVLEAQTLLQTPAISVSFDTNRRDTQCKECVPQAKSFAKGEVQLPALLTDIRDTESPNRHALNVDFLCRGIGKRFMGDALGIIHQFLQRGAGFGAPKTQRRNLFGLIDKGHITQRELVAHALHPNIVTMPRITATDDPKTVLCEANNR